MYIYQAMREKKKLAGKIAKLEQTLQSNNSVMDGNTRNYDPNKVLAEIVERKLDLVRLKTAIMAASAPIFSKIMARDEYKGLIRSIQSLNCSEGIVHRGMGEPVKYTAAIGELARDGMVEKYEKAVEAIQEEIDKFNYTTEVAL